MERLLADGHTVIALERDAELLGWLDGQRRAASVVGEAGDPTGAERAVDEAEAMGRFCGWVNNAAVFRDASLGTDPLDEVLQRIHTNLDFATVGAGVAIRRFLARETPGAIVNVSSHQAQRAVHRLRVARGISTTVAVTDRRPGLNPVTRSVRSSPTRPAHPARRTLSVTDPD